eukprot:752540-Hanusia_phi.AAC.2
MLICRQVSGDELQSLSVRIKFQLPSLPSYSFCTATNGVTQEAAYLQSDVGKLPDDCNCIIIRQRYFNATLLRTVLSQQKLPRVEYLILYENIEEGVEKILEAALYLEHLRVLIIQGVELKLLEQDALASILHKHRIMDLVLHRNRFNGNGRKCWSVDDFSGYQGQLEHHGVEFELLQHAMCRSVDIGALPVWKS